MTDPGVIAETILTPAWVLVGGPTRDGQVELYASRELDRAQLAACLHLHGKAGTVSKSPSPVVTYVLTANVRRFVRVTAPTYAEALVMLGMVWQPGDEPAPEPAQPLCNLWVGDGVRCNLPRGHKPRCSNSNYF